MIETAFSTASHILLVLASIAVIVLGLSAAGVIVFGFARLIASGLYEWITGKEW